MIGKIFESTFAAIICIALFLGGCWFGYKVGYYIGYMKGRAGRLIPVPTIRDIDIDIDSEASRPPNPILEDPAGVQ